MMEEEISRNVMAHALLGDSSMLNAVASLLRKHNGTQQEKSLDMSSPMLVLTSSPGKHSYCADVILGSHMTTGMKMRPAVKSSEETSNLMTSFEEVHALATASLVASTQREIAEQLAQEASYKEEMCIAEDNEKTLVGSPCSASSNNRERKVKARDLSKQVQNHTDKTDVSNEIMEKNVKREPKEKSEKKSTDCSQMQALSCSFKGCERKFAWQNHLKYHEMTHTNNRRYQCPVSTCSKSFFTAQRLEVHRRTHTGERPFTCKYLDCGKSFTTAGNLKNHQRIHTGERPFACDYPSCNLSFAEQSSLKKHKRRHTGAKPFLCDKCSQTFTQSSSLSKHMLRHRLDEEIRRSKEIPNNGDVIHKSEESPLSFQVKLSSPDHKEVSCSPQVIVLNNSFQDLPRSESIVFSHELSEHAVAVSSQTVENLASTLLESHGIQEESAPDKSEELILLSEAQVFGDGGTAGDLVYGGDILAHEQVTPASYVTTHVDYSENMTGSEYMQTEVTGAYTEVRGDYAQTEVLTDYQREVTVVSTDYTHQSDLIGAEEETVSTSYNLSPSKCNKTDDVDSSHVPEVEQYDATDQQFINKISVSVEQSDAPVCCNSISGRLADSGMYMDPMMPWDEEPIEKHNS